jgi:hypothetical protein
MSEMQMVKQLSVPLVNKPGRLADLLTALNKGKVDFRALALMDSTERGMVRFVPDDFDTAIKVLDKLNMRYDTSEVLLAEIPNQPGGFRKICERLAAEHLSIDYAYCSFHATGKAKGGVAAVIKVNNPAKAQRVLSANGTVKKRRPIRRPVMSMMGD